VGPIELKYYVEDVDRHANIRRYFRRKGQRKIRLPGLPGSVEFMDAYRSALANLPEDRPRTVGRPAIGSFGHVCLSYYASPTFKRLAQSTQSWRRRALDSICEQHGDKRIALMSAKHVRILRNEMAKLPGASRNRLKALKALFAWSVDEGLATDDPTLGVKNIPYATKSHHTWTLDEVEQYETHHPVGTKARLALALLLYTSWRREDAPRIGPQHIYEERQPDGSIRKSIKYRLAKNEERGPVDMDIPLHPDLECIIDATPSGHLSFLITAYGKPYTTGGFGNRFKDWCRQAGLPHCSCHGLRSAVATRLANSGASQFEIMAITGHKSLKEVERYTKAANRKKLADSAMGKFK
jgi:integrase/recombinase XerD